MGKRKVFTEEEITKSIMTPGPSQVIGKVMALLGSGWAIVLCEDGKTRRCRVRGKLRRRIWVRVNDMVLVEPWSFQQDHGEILFRYTENQVGYLTSRGFLKEGIVKEVAHGQESL
jgi:translation initiation factor 1A